jgi:hypothetical protein
VTPPTPTEITEFDRCVVLTKYRRCCRPDDRNVADKVEMRLSKSVALIEAAASVAISV